MDPPKIRNNWESTGINVLRWSSCHAARGMRVNFRLYPEKPYNLAAIVETRGGARQISGKRAEVGHHSLPPKESVRRRIAGEVGIPDNLTLVVNVGSNIVSATSKVAKVSNRPILPKQSMKERLVRSITRCTGTRPAHDFSSVVEGESGSVRVTGKCRQFVNFAPLPNDRLKSEHLGWNASRVWAVVLYLTHHLIPVVDLESH
jgi:hypothetical protein